MIAKSSGSSAAASLKVPEGWLDAPPHLNSDIAARHPQWFGKLASRFSSPMGELDWRGLTAEQKRAAFIIECAKTHELRMQAKEAERFFEENHIQPPWSERMEEFVQNLTVREISHERKQPVFGGRITKNYDWLADRHLGPELRLALGYRRSGFQKLRNSAQIAPARKGGSARAYTFKEMTALLLARFLRTPVRRRKKIAETIWMGIGRKSGKQKTVLQNFLVKFGAACDDAPSSSSI
jgi:hypothetical protein